MQSIKRIMERQPGHVEKKKMEKWWRWLTHWYRLKHEFNLDIGKGTSCYHSDLEQGPVLAVEPVAGRRACFALAMVVKMGGRWVATSLSTYRSFLTTGGTSAKPLTLSRSAVLRKAGNWSWATFTSPAYMNSKIACRWAKGTSFRMMIGCLDGFSYIHRKEM